MQTSSPWFKRAQNYSDWFNTAHSCLNQFKLIQTAKFAISMMKYVKCRHVWRYTFKWTYIMNYKYYQSYNPDAIFLFPLTWSPLKWLHPCQGGRCGCSASSWRGQGGCGAALQVQHFTLTTKLVSAAVGAASGWCSTTGRASSGMFYSWF